MRISSLLVCLTFVAVAMARAAFLEERGTDNRQPLAVSRTGAAGTEQESSPRTAGDTGREKDDVTKDDVTKEVLSGKVVALPDALKRHGIKSYSDEIKNQVVLETEQGELVPIVPDWRGRAFYQDERLRDRQVDLIIHRRKGVPWVQVLSIYAFDEQGVRNIVDYWCDVCSIPMYEIKDCECCQGPTRLRLRPQELPKDLPRPTKSEPSNSSTAK